MESLPLDISLNILSRLPITSLFHCKRVCKAWLNLAHDPRLPYLHFAYQKSQNNPSLILHSSISSSHLYLVDNCVEPNDDDDYCNNGVARRFKLPFAHEKFIDVLYCNGLLCLPYIEYHGLLIYVKIYIYNPCTEEVTSLPDPMAKKYKGEAYGFGFHPGSEEYKVVRIVEYESVVYNYNLDKFEPSLDQSVEVFTLGGDDWKPKRKNPFWLRMQPCEASVNGALHWFAQAKLFYAQIIVGFDLLDEVFRQIPSPHWSLNESNSILMVLGGCLSVVVYSGNYLDIWLMKEYGVKESWTKEITIRPDILMDGNYRPLCILKNGKILLEYANRQLLSYDPETKSYKKIKIDKLPGEFQEIPHIESIISAL